MSEYTLLQIGTWVEVAILALMVWDKAEAPLRKWRHPLRLETAMTNTQRGWRTAATPSVAIAGAAILVILYLTYWSGLSKAPLPSAALPQSTSSITATGTQEHNGVNLGCAATILGVLNLAISTNPTNLAAIRSTKTIMIVNSSPENDRMAKGIGSLLQSAFYAFLTPGNASSLVFLRGPDTSKYEDAPSLSPGNERGIIMHGSGPVFDLIANALGVDSLLPVRQTARFQDKDGKDIRDALLNYYHTKGRAEYPTIPLDAYNDILWIQIGPHGPWEQTGSPCAP